MAVRTHKHKLTAGDASSTNVGEAVPFLSFKSQSSRDWLWGAILFLSVILTYQPVWYAGFVWDDDAHVTMNPCVVGPLGLKEIWTSSPGQFFPLVMTTFWIEHALWGLAPLPYHLLNVSLQATSAVLLWRVLLNLQVPGAWFGASLWTLHPLQVESVAWVSELKNTQSCVFYLLTILFFVRWLRGEGSTHAIDWNYVRTLMCAALAMASKSSTLVLPAVLILCILWVKGRWSWPYLLRLAPVFVLSVAASAVTLWPGPPDLAALANPEWTRSWPERIAVTGDTFWFYLGKLLWPCPLMTVYPRWKIDGGQWSSYLPLVAAAGALTLLWLKRWRVRPWFFAFFYFLVVLAPFLGFIDESYWRYSFVQDHLQYLAAMGPLALAGAGMVRWSNSILPRKPWLPWILGTGVLAVLAYLSWQRCWAYETEEALWIDNIAKNPNCSMGLNNLANLQLQRGQEDNAMALYRKALEIRPNFFEVHNNLGNVLMHKGQVDEAITEFQKALKINPNFFEAYNNLGTAFIQKGQVDEAIAQYRKAMSLGLKHAGVYTNLGSAELEKGDADGAMAQFKEALKVDPTYVKAYYCLGNVLLQKGKVNDAIDQYQRALQLKPNYAEAYSSLGSALLETGQLDQSIEQYEKALQIDPNNAEAHCDLGVAFFKDKQVDRAIDEYQGALEIDPKKSEALCDLGVALFQEGRTDEAITQYQKALSIEPNFIQVHTNLGRALVQDGRLPEAVAQFQEVVRLNPHDKSAQRNLAVAQAMLQQKKTSDK